MAELTIRHTYAEGTLLEGSAKGDGVWELARAHGFRWSANVGMYLPRSRDKQPMGWKLGPLRRSLEFAGHTVTEDLEEGPYRPAAQVEADRAERTEVRVERLETAAGRAAARADAAGKAHDRIADGIPFGQPILVGHHSEGRARRDHARIQALTQRQFDESDAADEYARRATAAAERHDATQRPRAIMRKIETLLAEQREWERRLGGVSPSGGYARYQLELDRVVDELQHLRGKLAQMEADGTFVAWSPASVKVADLVLGIWGWCPVVRVNVKSVSLGKGRTVVWSDIHGVRRRSVGLQWDKPNAVPWPIADAEQVDQWLALLRQARGGDRWAELPRRIGVTRRLVVGLPADATDAELAAFDVTDVAAGRALAIASLAVYRQLEGDARADEVALMVSPQLTVEPTWRMPAGEAQKVRVDRLQPGMIIAGLWQNGELWRGLSGPVVEVSEVEHHRERGDWVTFRLLGGSEHSYQTHVWVAAHPAA